MELEFVPCVHCKRHVGVSETACPFCASSLPAQRPQHVLVAAFTRAAIFSAAAVAGIAGCEAKQAKSVPAPTQQQGSAMGSGSDDLEKLLDVDQRVVDHGSGTATESAVLDAGVPSDAAALAVADAGVRPVDPKILKLKREAMEKRRRDRENARNAAEEKVNAVERIHPNPMPYGAPPARRRVV
jgi:hypothetical protein